MEDPARRQRLLLETIRFPVYGLEPDWKRQRWLAFLSTFEETVGIVGLCHGSRAGRGDPMVQVESYAPPPDEPGPGAEDALARLMIILERLSNPRATVDEQSAFHERARIRAANASVGEVEIAVCGDSVPFSIVAEGPLWAAVPTKQDLDLKVLGVADEPSRLRLMKVDPELYLDGSVALARE